MSRLSLCLSVTLLLLVNLIAISPLHTIPPASAASLAPARMQGNNLASAAQSGSYSPTSGGRSGNCQHLYPNTCLDPLPSITSSWGYYVGHDEPSVQFFSTTPGSGNHMRWQIQLPATDPTPTQSGTKVANAELYGTFWFGLAACDPFGKPYGPCTADSDTNNPATAGSAFLELQFDPPGTGCATSTQWCALMQFNSIEDQAGCNIGETFNDVTVTTNGANGGPVLDMSPGDKLQVSIYDTVSGMETDVNDLTSSTTGFMVASTANGFNHTNPTTCVQSLFAYHPEYSTASPSNGVPWATLFPNVDFDVEIGHSELCGNTSCSPLPDSDGDDVGCGTVLGIGICGGKDTDFDGLSYQTDWPDGSASHPSSIIIQAPSGTGVGPLSFSSGSYQAPYDRVHFVTTQCYPNGSSCSASFYPYYSQTATGASCTLLFGNHPTGATNDFGKQAQYGTTIDNPCAVTMTLSYSIVGGAGSSSAPIFHYVSGGASATYTVTAAPSPVYPVDTGSAWSVDDPLGGSTAFERWKAPPSEATSGTASFESLGFTYYRQYLQTLSYAIVPASNPGLPTVPTFTADQFAASTPQLLTESATGYWFDAGSSWSVANNPLTGSTSTQRWITFQSTSGTVSSAQTILFDFHHQFFLTVKVTPSATEGSTSVASGFQDYLSPVSITAIPNAGYAFNDWTTSGVTCLGGSTTNPCTFTMPLNAATVTANFEVQLVITLLGPPSGSRVTQGGLVNVVLKLQVTALGKPVQGAAVSFVVDGTIRCTTITSSTGMASCGLKVPLSIGGGFSHQWYATASKPGYASAKSVTWIFIS